MSATEFTVDLEDLRFNLFDVLDIDRSLASIEKYNEFDQDTLEGILEEARRLAVEVLHPLNRRGDTQGCRLDDDGNVTTPDGYREAWALMSEGGWHATTAPAEVGGIGLPTSVGMAVTEMFAGACMAFGMYGGLTSGAARVILHFAPEPFRTELPPRMFSGEWAGTMCLTEADAGTAVGDNRCKAIPTDDPGVFHLEGEKIFISGGDQDLTENILHLVLARTPDAPNGSRGISMFLVPKFNIEADGSLGERNDARVVSIEHKMGINGSSTCVLALGTRGVCKGWLIGELGEGLPIMFNLMNEARIGVAIQGLAVGAAAYNYSRAYATERIQGTSVQNFKDADAPRVPIVDHPDVRRMLMTQKVHVETMRSFLLRLAVTFDQASDESLDEAERARLLEQVELLVPIAKAHCTDVGFEVAVTAVQIFGGYGYIQEYPVEQLVRDGKIASIYEGTNGVQAMDLLGRKMRMKGGGVFMAWMQGALGNVGKHAAAFPQEAEAIGKAINHLGATAMHLGGLGAKGKLDAVMLQATPFLRMFGTVCLAIEALEQAAVASRLLEERAETPHLKSKALNLKFYVANVLPQAVALGKSIQTDDDSCLDEVLFA